MRDRKTFRSTEIWMQFIDRLIATVRQSLETKDIRPNCLLDPLPRIVQGDLGRVIK